MKKIFLLLTMLFCLSIQEEVLADELTANFELSNGGDSSAFIDGSHYSLVTFNEGDTITITSTDGSAISGVYITWDCPTVPWTLTTDNGDISCGANGFIHEYVSIEASSKSITINIPGNGMAITSIRIFSEGELPHDVQVWNAPCEKADIMVIASHADDEILFFGGILPTYSYEHDAAIQVVYMAEFWGYQKVREHEKLDGLWEAGIRYYPVCGGFGDYYSEDIATAESQYDVDAMIEYVVEQFRIFKPQVVITHDINGEYGHGYHMLTSKTVQDAVAISADATQYPDSATTYGVWDVPKTYLHIYKENSITLDLRVPIEEDYAGRTAFDIAVEAYKKHVSQQWCWFYVSDDNAYSCADFGLYRTLVGDDTTDDILCNIKTYKVQAEEEEARLKAEEESRKAEEESREQASKEAASIEQASRQEASRQAASEEESRQTAKEQKEKKQAITTASIIIVAIIAVIIGFIYFSKKKRSSAK